MSQSNPASQEHIVKTEHLSRRFGRVLALNEVNLTIPKGAIYGLIGPNGAGKTTTMRILTTLLSPTSGAAWIAGYHYSKVREVRRSIGFMPDFFGVYDNMRAWEYLDFFAAAYFISANRRSSLINEMLDLVGLSDKRDEFVMGLSRGMKQRLSLARTLLHNPSLLILDEPASGLDPRARIELRELLKELRVMGKTIMISSHILTELAEVCTHIGIIDSGKLLLSGDIKTIMDTLNAHRRILEIQVIKHHDRAVRFIQEVPDVSEVRLQEHQGQLPMIHVDYGGDEQGAAGILSYLTSHHFQVVHFATQKLDLEDIFMKFTNQLPPSTTK